MGLAQFAEVTCGGRQKMGGWDMLVMDVVEGGGELRQEVHATKGHDQGVQRSLGKKGRKASVPDSWGLKEV